jgi:hypothetical protein
LRSDQKSWKRKLAWKIAFIVAIAFLILIVVLAFAPSENVWIQTKRELEARGEILDWEKFIPSEVPDDQNLFGDPIAASLLPMKGNPAPPNPLDVPAPQMPPNIEELGLPFEIAKLKGIPRVIPTSKDQTTLTGLAEWFAQWDQSFAQLREAGERPAARRPGNYTTPVSAPIPNFVAIRTLAYVLASRAKVHLIMGNSAQAYEDIETLAVVMKSLESAPGTLVSAMVQVAVAGVYIDTVEEGLRAQLWQDSELRKLILDLQQQNLIAVVQQGIRAERAALLRHFEALANRESDPLYISSVDLLSNPSKQWSFERVLLNISPATWVRRNQARYAQFIQGYLDGLDPRRRRIDLIQIERTSSEILKVGGRWSPHNMLTMNFAPNFSRAASTLARNQTRIDQAMIAGALERFRFRHDRYPEELNELVPQYMEVLPVDVFRGKPFTYARNRKGWELSTEAADPLNRAPLTIKWTSN